MSNNELRLVSGLGNVHTFPSKTANKDFGPWLVEISSQKEVPYPFKLAFTYKRNAFKTLKKPSFTQTPSSNAEIYEQLFVVKPEAIEIWDADKGNIHCTSLNYKDIDYIQVHHQLLVCELILVSHNQSYVLEYNGVSENLIQEIVTYIRSKLKYGGHHSSNMVDLLSTSMTFLPSSIEDLSPLYKSAYNQISQKEITQILGYTSEQKMTLKTSGLAGLIRRQEPITNHGYLQLGTKFEQIFITCKQQLSNRKTYSTIITYFPKHKLRHESIDTDPMYKNLQHVTYQIGLSMFTYII